MTDKKIPEPWEKVRGTDQFATGGDVTGEDLAGANLSDIRVKDPVADRVDLRRAVMEHFRCIDGSFVDARFDGAFLGSAVFFDAVMARACLDAVQGENASLATSILKGASLVAADLPGVDLSGTDLDEADLTDAILVGATATQASFRKAKLANADLGDADLSEADFRGAELAGVRWDGAKLDGAQFDKGADPRATS